MHIEPRSTIVASESETQIQPPRKRKEKLCVDIRTKLMKTIYLNLEKHLFKINCFHQVWHNNRTDDQVEHIPHQDNPNSCNNCHNLESFCKFLDRIVCCSHLH